MGFYLKNVSALINLLKCWNVKLKLVRSDTSDTSDTYYLNRFLAGFTSCQMMSCWRFCPRPKTPQPCNRTCASALRTSRRSVTAACSHFPHMLLTLCATSSVLILFIFWSLASVPARSANHTHVLRWGRGGEALCASESCRERGGVAQACGEIHEGHAERQHRPLATSLPRGPTLFFPLCFLTEMKRSHSNVSLFVDPPATSYRVGVVLARPGGHRRLSGLLDHRGVWGLGAGRLVQQPLPTTAEAGQRSRFDITVHNSNCAVAVEFLFSDNINKGNCVSYLLLPPVALLVKLRFFFFTFKFS